MPFIRLNQDYIYDVRKYDANSNIYKAYHHEVEMLTASSLIDMHLPNYLDCYVKFDQHSQVESLLETNGVDGLVYLTGVTGSGKTTLLSAALNNKKNDIAFHNETIIITFVWKPTYEEKEEPERSLTRHYSNFLIACSKKICDTYCLPDYTQKYQNILKYIEDNDFDYYSFCDKTNNINECINILKEKNAIKFALFTLRYVVLNSPIKNVLFLFDELEEAGRGNNNEPLEIIIIQIAYTIKQLLSSRTTVSKEAEGFRYTVLISCRHYVYRMITYKKEQHSNSFWNQVNAESQSETSIDLPQSPDLINLIQKRKDVIKETLKSDNDKSEFEEVYSIAKDILNKADDIILSLSIGNIRDAFKYLQYLLFNKRWFQKRENYMGAFSINSSRDDYNLKLTSYLRALALRENTVYTHESIIPNLLDNTNGKKDLSILIVLSFFINRQQDPEIRKNFFSQYDVELEFNSIVKEIFKEEAYTYYKSFEYLLLNKLILRSAYSCQEDSADEPNINDISDKWKYVYISRQANVLWNLLGNNSVLFELFIDDIKLKGCLQNKDDLKKRSYLQFNVPAFKECINYLEQLIDVESFLWNDLSSKSYLTLYKENFGYKPICLHLYKGLINSFESYYRKKENEPTYSDLNAMLTKLRTKLFGCDIFNITN